jgi:hypothetical protein
MRHKSLCSALSEKKRGHLLIACALTLLCLSQAAIAQSGRRQIKRDAAPPIIAPEIKTEEVAKPPKAKASPIASLIVGGDTLSSTFDVPSGYLDIAINSCIERLSKASSLMVKSAGSSMRRKEAIDKAKKQEEAYVVWVDLKSEMGGASQTGLILEYSIFSPQTAKVKDSGHIYLDRARNSRVGVGLPQSIGRKLPLDYLMKEGGRELANRVMNIFHVSARD